MRTVVEGKHVCILECSNSKDQCPSGSKCIAAPKLVANEDVKFTCVFEKPADKVQLIRLNAENTNQAAVKDIPIQREVYENPWTKSTEGACNFMEKFISTTFNKKTYGLCLGHTDLWYAGCQKPHNFDKGIDAYKITYGGLD